MLDVDTAIVIMEVSTTEGITVHTTGITEGTIVRDAIIIIGQGAIITTFHMLAFHLFMGGLIMVDALG